uniref:Uncharacterized protein n=1 Tax=Micrurus carvalhoi TaxID=3147026 RepID=A0A2H6N000_9SAUR
MKLWVSAFTPWGCWEEKLKIYKHSSLVHKKHNVPGREIKSVQGHQLFNQTNLIFTLCLAAQTTVKIPSQEGQRPKCRKKEGASSVRPMELKSLAYWKFKKSIY